MSYSLDPDQAQHFVVPDLGTNCLQRLSADKELKLVNKLFVCWVIFHAFVVVC